MSFLSTSLSSPSLLPQLLLQCSPLLLTYPYLLLQLLFLSPVLAPVPRCGPFIIINKVPDAVSLISDLNPFFPVPPCEYGGPLQALRAGDYESVFGGLPGQIYHLPLFPKGQLARHNLLEGIHVLAMGPSQSARHPVIAWEIMHLAVPKLETGSPGTTF